MRDASPPRGTILGQNITPEGGALEGESEEMVEPVASWSGQFWMGEGGVGFMSVQHSDERLHKPPADWDLTEIHDDEEAETYVYRFTGRGAVPPVSVAISDQHPAAVRMAVQADEA